MDYLNGLEIAKKIVEDYISNFKEHDKISVGHLEEIVEKIAELQDEEYEQFEKEFIDEI